MRVALVSPYSWTYPGGVTRHIEALAAELVGAGHDVRVLAPFDPDVRRTALLHRGARPQARPRPEWLVPLGPDDRLAVQRRRLQPRAHAVRRLDAAARAARGRLRRRARARAGRARRRLGRADHRRRAARGHVPLLLGERAAARRRRAARRAAQAQPPVGADRGLRGRGLDRPALLRRPLPGDPQRRRAARRAAVPAPRAARARRAAADRVRRPGRRAQGPAGAAARLRGAAPPGAGRADRRRRRRRGARAAAARRRGRDARSAASATPRSAPRCEAADVLCAPSLGGESFGMVLTEAFAAGTPVVASDIAGYRDVVTDGRDGLLVPRGDATRLAETLRDLALDPARDRAAGRRGRAAAPSATPGRGSPPRWPTPTRTRARCERPAGALAPRGRARRHACPPTARRAPAAAAAVAGAAGRERRAARAALARRGLLGARRAGRRRRHAAGARADRPAPDRPGAAGLEPDLGARRARADVRLDAACAPSPGTRSSRRRCPTRCRASPTPCRAPRSAC